MGYKNHHLLYNLLNVFIVLFNNAVHLRSVRGRVMMLDFERLTKLLHHLVIQIGPIVGNDLFGYSVMTNKILLNEPIYHLLGDIGISCRFDPFRKIIYGNQNEMVPVGRSRFNFADHINSPHRKRPRGGQDIQSIGGICTLSA